MKTKEYQGSEERSILIGLIVNDEILGRILHSLKEERRPFRSKWCNIIAGWCFSHFSKYQKAPCSVVQSLFEKYAQEAKDKEAIELIESFLSGLSQEYKQLSKDLNEQHLIDTASVYFDKVRMERLFEEGSDLLGSNDVDGARALLSSHEKIDFSSSAWVDLFGDEVIKRVFSHREEEESLIQFRGALGGFLSPTLTRTRFVSFVGPSGRGKSFWLQEMVWQALRQRRRVLYYSFGDMMEKDVAKRFYSRVLRRPWIFFNKDGSISSDTEREIGIPTRILLNGEDEADRKLKRCRVRRIAGDLVAVREAREQLKRKTASKEVRLLFRGEGGDVISAGEIEQEVKHRSAGGWVPDVVVIDYADLLAPEPHTRREEKRHQFDASWKILKRIASKQSCLVMTATQTAKSGYNARVIRKKDFSEDRRKNDHVDGMIGINQTEGKEEDVNMIGEKKRGLYRLNWVKNRHYKWSENQVVWCAGCLDIACPCIISAF